MGGRADALEALPLTARTVPQIGGRNGGARERKVHERPLRLVPEYPREALDDFAHSLNPAAMTRVSILNPRVEPADIPSA
jgi:hypothetical protein